jgi:hypothetical protein
METQGEGAKKTGITKGKKWRKIDEKRGPYMGHVRLSSQVGHTQMRQNGGAYRLHLQDVRVTQTTNQHEAGCKLVSCLVYSVFLKMEVICSSETCVDFQRVTRRYISMTELFIITAVRTTGSMFP